MAHKAYPTDWDRIMSPRARPRRGPVALLIIVTLTIAFLLFITFSAGFGLRQYQQYQVAMALTATPLWAEYYAQQTATAQAGSASAAATPAPAPETIGSVIGTANLRSEPRVAPETIIGLLEAGDRAAVLQTETIDGQAWYRVRVAETAGALSPGTEGWINGVLLSLP
jgi:hypothetical protein